jgi:LPS export ABC transporter protein LptC
MKKFLFLLLVVTAVGATLWHVRRGQVAQDAGAAAGQQTGPAYAFEAQDVTVRQMGPDGRLQYELAARRFAQSADGGDVVAEDLTIHHDPPGTVPGGQHRWTLTAARAQLPAEGQVITMQGDVRASGLPRGRSTPVRIDTGQMHYDIASHVVSGDADVRIEWGASRFESRGFKVNINTGDVELESAHGTIAP